MMLSDHFFRKFKFGVLRHAFLSAGVIHRALFRGMFPAFRGEMGWGLSSRALKLSVRNLLTDERHVPPAMGPGAWKSSWWRDYGCGKRNRIRRIPEIRSGESPTVRRGKVKTGGRRSADGEYSPELGCRGWRTAGNDCAAKTE